MEVVDWKIDTNSPIPFYYQLEKYFEQLIESGVWAKGMELPSEGEISSNENTINNKAIISLTGVTSKSLPQSSYCKSVGRTVIFNNNHAPANEAKIAGIPKRSKTDLSVFLPTNAILKRLFEKCTTPVSAMAISIGKNIAKTGTKIVPSPKPEKNVKTAVKNAAKQIMMISIQSYF